MPRVGVLGLQGDVREHVALLEHLGADVVRVRRPEEFAQVEGLVIPGGESTVMDKLSRAFGLRDPIRAAIADGMPMLGTCAGLIMLSDRLADGIVGQQTFGGLDVLTRRNAFGRQVDSFEGEVPVPAFVGEPVSATFIRGPVVEEVGADAAAMASLPAGTVVAVEQGNLMGISFHPELSGEPRFHQRFLDRVSARG
ncbi:pyridoxal 5'-phosphate synthase glutaminase subunit PdxT [Microbacterium sp.]|uniref:pyridoxal 5'-phosphate synthase glutaminase subunit PdxT n=1 Tax=Microbacterium sp. TaxID=51671 RepID=UPI002606EAF2|nr:pyridoxal 5'-phosphate synthase glutaminase subunit PdxT [uncultured Microbacterium sp.]